VDAELAEGQSDAGVGLEQRRHGRGDAGGYFFSSLLPIRILSVLRERVTTATPSRGTGLTSYQGGAGVTAAMTALLKADAGVGLALGQLGIHLPGLSTYAICRTSA
jgi:hypothetical protein